MSCSVELSIKMFYNLGASSLSLSKMIFKLYTTQIIIISQDQKTKQIHNGSQDKQWNKDKNIHSTFMHGRRERVFDFMGGGHF